MLRNKCFIDLQLHKETCNQIHTSTSLIKDISIDGYTRDAQGFALRVRNKIETDTSIVTYPLSPLLLHNHVYKLSTMLCHVYNHVYNHVFNLSVWKCGRPPILVLDLDQIHICILQVIFIVCIILSDVSCMQSDQMNSWLKICFHGAWSPPPVPGVLTARCRHPYQANPQSAFCTLQPRCTGVEMERRPANVLCCQEQGDASLSEIHHRHCRRSLANTSPVSPKDCLNH